MPTSVCQQIVEENVNKCKAFIIYRCIAQFRCIGQRSNKAENIITSILKGPARDYINQIVLGVVDVSVKALGNIQSLMNWKTRRELT